MRLLSVSLIILIVVNIAYGQQQSSSYDIKSPDNSVRLNITVDDKISFSVDVDGAKILEPSVIGMSILNGDVLGENPAIIDVNRTTVTQKLKPVIPEKFSVIHDHCNELMLTFKKNFALIFRVYDNGVAYRFKTNFKETIKVTSEQLSLNFNGKDHVYYPEEDSFFSHNERLYVVGQIDALGPDRLASLPVLIETSGPKVLIAESALRDYPGMWIKTGNDGQLNAVFPHYPLKSELREESDRDMPVTEYADYIANTEGRRSYPWRIMAIAKSDAELVTNQLVYQLADELKIKDPSWIKPGKVAWDWWNANNIYGVDFKSGVNTETYKYYIDFASQYGIEYIILDEGWYKLGDLMDVVPEMDVKEIIEYGKKKNVGIILWVIWKTLDDQLEMALDQFEKWGAAGIKVDFMQRDDQEMVNYYWKIAAEAAKRNMLVDYHGAYKPAGLRRAYPNVITREGVKGLENCKWSADITPTHNVTIPFIRMVPGPMDYTPGAMINAQPENYNSVFSRPMSMGTRAHQVAMYVIYESPLQMMADNPSNYLKESESASFIAQIPVTWDKTVVLKAKVGEYLVLARKKGEHWYVGAMTNEEMREFTIDLSFLDANMYDAHIFEDGMNADRFASDYRLTKKTISKTDTLSIKLAPGGGYAAKLMVHND